MESGQSCIGNSKFEISNFKFPMQDSSDFHFPSSPFSIP